MRSLILVGVLASLVVYGQAWAADQEDPYHAVDAHLFETYKNDLPGLLERKYFRVLTTMNRTNFFLAGGKVRGFEYSLLKEYEKYLNEGIGRRELKVTRPPSWLRFIETSPSPLFSGMIDEPAYIFRKVAPA